MADKIDLTYKFADMLFELIQQKAVNTEQSYGFEYEFLPADPISIKAMEKLHEFLPECGFVSRDNGFHSSSGIFITFEPGGQIEFHSPPIFPEEDDLFYQVLNVMETTNSQIQDKVGIQYVGKGFMPNRQNTPLCLKEKRYKNLHARMPKCGSRGHEMMKGTASIHLHVVLRNVRELPALFSALCKMAVSDDFKMLPDRRDIWNNTDPCRCGQPFGDYQSQKNPRQWIEDIVRFALKAYDIGENIPFEDRQNISFDDFLYHMTTLYTDVRLNIKWPTVELRTLDSMPLQFFKTRWDKFVSTLEDVKTV